MARRRSSTLTTFERRPPLVWRGISMSREMDDFALPLLPLTNINFANPPFMLFSLYRALQMKEKEKMKRKQGANTVAHPWGIWHAVFSLKPSGPQPKHGGRKAGKFLELAMFFFFFFRLYLVSPCLPLLLAGSHDSFFRERGFLDGRGGRDGAARHLVFLSRFTRSCFLPS